MSYSPWPVPGPGSGNGPRPLSLPLLDAASEVNATHRTTSVVCARPGWPVLARQCFAPTNYSSTRFSSLFGRSVVSNGTQRQKKRQHAPGRERTDDRARSGSEGTPSRTRSMIIPQTLTLTTKIIILIAATHHLLIPHAYQTRRVPDAVAGDKRDGKNVYPLSCRSRYVCKLEQARLCAHRRTHTHTSLGPGLTDVKAEIMQARKSTAAPGPPQAHRLVAGGWMEDFPGGGDFVRRSWGSKF